MCNDRRNNPDRPVGELWVELSRDEKKSICEALIDWNKPDVMQEFATLVRFTRGYLRQQTNGSGSSSNKKRKNEEVLVAKVDKPFKKLHRNPWMGKFQGRQIGLTHRTVPAWASQIESEYEKSARETLSLRQH